MGIGDGVVLPIAFALLALMVRSARVLLLVVLSLVVSALVAFGSMFGVTFAIDVMSHESCCGSASSLAWEEHELPSGRFARLATGADIVLWICQLVGARDGEHAFAMAPVVPPDRIDGPPPDGARRARRAPRRADAGRRRCRCRDRRRRARVGVADVYILL